MREARKVGASLPVFLAVIGRFPFKSSRVLNMVRISGGLKFPYEKLFLQWFQ